MNKPTIYALFMAVLGLMLYQQHRISTLKQDRDGWRTRSLMLQDDLLGDSLLLAGNWAAARAHHQHADPETRAVWLANVDAVERADNVRKSKETDLLKKLSAQSEELALTQKTAEHLREQIVDMRKRMRVLADSAQSRAMEYFHIAQQRDSLLQEKEAVLTQLTEQLHQLSTALESKTVVRFKSPAGVDILYFGQTKDEKPHGHGLGFYSNGTKYDGEWDAGDKHGMGNYTYPNGERYEGTFSRNKRNGLGTYTWPNGDTYRGYWKDDKRNGEGAIKNAKGQVLRSGLWQNDKLAEGRAVDLK